MCGKCGHPITGDIPREWNGRAVCEKCWEKLAHGGEYQPRPAARAVAEDEQAARSNAGVVRFGSLSGTALGIPDKIFPE